MDTKLSTNRKFKRMAVGILSILVVLVLAFPVTAVAYTTPVFAKGKLPVGNRIGLLVGPAEYPPNTPFHIRQGWLLTSYDDAVGVFDFKLEVDGILQKEDFKDFWSESGDPDALQRRWVFNFPDGMTGTHTFIGHWLAPCQYAVNQLGYPGPCLTPNAKVEAETATLTVNFTPTFVAYVPGAIEGYNWPMGNTITINVNGDEYTAQAVSEQRPDFLPGETRVLFEIWREGMSLEAGDYIVMIDEAASITKEVVVTNLAVTDFDLSERTVSGIYDPAYDLWVWLYDLGGQAPAMDPDNGAWVATFAELPPGAWGAAAQHDADGDGTSIDFQVPNTRVVIASEPDWVDSGIAVNAGQSIRIEAFGLMNPCSDTYPNGADYCIFYTPLGAEGVAPDENEFGIFPGPGLRFMALLGRIGDGGPFYIGEGGVFTAEQSGTLWFTPNDNLRTDNQGVYNVLVWLEP